MCCVMIRESIWLWSRIEHVLASSPGPVERKPQVIVVHNDLFIGQLGIISYCYNSEVEGCPCDVRKLNGVFALREQRRLVPLSICLRIRIGIVGIV